MIRRYFSAPDSYKVANHILSFLDFPFIEKAPLRPLNEIEEIVYEIMLKVLIKSGCHVLFLDIDETIFDRSQEPEINRALALELGKLPRDTFAIGFIIEKVTSAFFDEWAVKNIHDLIKKDNLAIVLSTQRKHGKSFVYMRIAYEKHSFSHCIVGKTADNIDQREADRICAATVPEFLMEREEAIEKLQLDTPQKIEEWEILKTNYFHRTVKILSWLKAHPFVKNFVIADDLELEPRNQPLFGARCIRVDQRVLLTKKNKEQALAALQGKIPLPPFPQT